MTELALQLPPEALEAIAQRAAELVLEQLRERDGSPAPTSPYLTVREAAVYLGAKRQRVYDLCSAGRLTRVKESGRTLIARDELDRYLAGEATGPAGATLVSVAQVLPRAYRDGYASAIRR